MHRNILKGEIVGNHSPRTDGVGNGTTGELLLQVLDREWQ